MGKLRTPYYNSGTIDVGKTAIDVRVVNNQIERVWVIEQLQVQYSISTDAPTVAIVLDGQVYSGPAQMLKGSSGVGQTFAGTPYLYVENDSDVIVRIQDGTAGALVTVQAQYREIGYQDEELRGRF